jgi:NAD(P)-dependent dehydrogenase (short-subunit alcohol dehydrogenase family)
MRFSGKTIVVTGAASGLGLAIASAAQAEGATIVAIDRDQAPFERTHLCDVAAEDQVARAIAGLDRIDGLVTSAGINRRTKVDETAMTDYDAVMAVNVRGVFLASKYALPLMRAHGGAILHLSSGVATTGTRNRAAYSASKGAIVSLTRNMALDYAADQVRVNCLCPGFVNTPLLATISPERRAKLTALHPLGRLGEPEDVAHMALFLLSDQAAWITGQAIAVDGGFNAGHMDDI